MTRPSTMTGDVFDSAAGSGSIIVFHSSVPLRRRTASTVAPCTLSWTPITIRSAAIAGDVALIAFDVPV